jgi:hypothetical protein
MAKPLLGALQQETPFWVHIELIWIIVILYDKCAYSL